MNRRVFLWCVAALLMSGSTGLAAGYDPLAVTGGTPRTLDVTVTDAARGREIPALAWLPETNRPAPVILFSHGLGGSRNVSRFLGDHWARRGYAAVFLQHPGSDDAVWREAGRGQRLRAMRRAGSPQNLLLRVQDVRAVLDVLERWNASPGGSLSGRLDMARVGMSGHSFGAVTTQALSGQTMPRSGTSWTDPRIKAALVLSPGAPWVGDPKTAFATVRVPWMLMTGTRDEVPAFKVDMASLLAVFPALPPGGKYELVLDGAEHSAFTDRPLPGDKAARNPNHHTAIKALSAAFWDACLKGDAQARAWLDGEGPRSVLERGDGWRRK